MAEAVLAPRARATRRGHAAEVAFKMIAATAAASLLAVLALMLFRLGQTSIPAWSHRSGQLLGGTRWAPNRDVYGGVPFIYGTIVTALIALAFALPIGLATALFLSEMATRKTRRILAPMVDLLAAVPSVVYGLWGFFVLVPTLLPVEHFLARTVGKVIPIFTGPGGFSYFSAGIVLAIMILPTISAISREVFVKVPREQREAALALGATRWEMIRTAVLPASRPGVIGAVILGLGRALGETIAVTMVIGNNPVITKSLLSPGYTLASVIANQFGESFGLMKQSLIALGLILFAVTLIVNILARLLVRRRVGATAGARA